MLAALLLLATELPVVWGANPPGQTPPITVSGLSGVTFLTTDFAPLRRFYGQGAGLTEVPIDPNRIRFAVGASQWIEFQRVQEANWARRLQYVTLATTDLGGLASALRSRGVDVTWIGPDQQRGSLQFADPAGNLIRAALPWSAPKDSGGRAIPFSMHLQHFGLAVPYSLAVPTMAFYRDTLGFPEGFGMNSPNGRPTLVKFRLPGPGGDLVELIFCEAPPDRWAAGAFDHLNFEVNDIDATYKALHRRGIATQSRHLPTVNGERLWAMDIIDPELTRMEVQVLAPTSTPIGTITTEGGESSRLLFDGRTLEGWEGNLSNWRVEDGAIVAGSLDRRQPYNEFLATKADYGNFELRLQYKVEGTGGFVNGGVQFWSQRVPGTFEVSGYQADLGAATDGNLYDESRRNAYLSVASAEVRDHALRLGAWNDYRIRAEGSHIEIWLNGIKTVDYTEGDKSTPSRGKFALQIHGGANTRVSYRHLEIETFPEPAGFVR